MMMTRAAALLLAAFAIFPAPSAMAADYTRPVAIERHVVVDEARLPQCFTPKVLDTIATAFEDKESEYWNSSLVLLSFAQPRELGYRPWGPEFIPRRFCSAETFASDHTRRTVFYSIGENTGTLGIKWGVEWCVTGLDRNLAYAPACRMAQP